MGTLEARLALMQAEAERLGWYLSTLSPDAWRQPSACQEWEVRDVVAHLVEVAQDYRCRIARGAQGEIGPHPAPAPPGTVTVLVPHTLRLLGRPHRAVFALPFARVNSLLMSVRGGGRPDVDVQSGDYARTILG